MDWPEIAGDPRFFQRAGPHTLAAVADAAEAEAPPRRLMLPGVAPLQTAGPDEVSFLDNRKYAAALEQPQAGAVIVHPDMAARVPAAAVAIVTSEPLRRLGPGRRAVPSRCRRPAPASTPAPWSRPARRSTPPPRSARWR